MYAIGNIVKLTSGEIYIITATNPGPPANKDYEGRSLGGSPDVQQFDAADVAALLNT